MLKPSRRFLLLVAAVTVLTPAGALPGGTPCVWTGVERVVAVGDVHGDYEQLVKVLRAAKLIDAEGDWAGGKAHLVQMGDFLDRAPDSRKVMDLLMKLQAQAPKAGGVVHPLIGNHEAMVLLGSWGYVHPGEVKAFGGPEAYREAMSPRGKYGRWIRSHNTVVQIDRVLFVHAGLTPRYAALSLGEINAAVRRELAAGNVEGIVGDPQGPLWTRSLAFAEGAEADRLLKPVLKAHEVDRIVIAHTVDRRGVRVQANGRVIRVDVGMSRYYGGPAACLLIDHGRLYEVRHGVGRRELPARGVLPPVPATQPSGGAHGKPSTRPALREAVPAGAR